MSSAAVVIAILRVYCLLHYSGGATRCLVWPSYVHVCICVCLSVFCFYRIFSVAFHDFIEMLHTHWYCDC